MAQLPTQQSAQIFSQMIQNGDGKQAAMLASQMVAQGNASQMVNILNAMVPRDAASLLFQLATTDPKAMLTLLVGMAQNNQSKHCKYWNCC